MDKRFLLASLLMFNVVFGVSLSTSLLSLYLSRVGVSLVDIGAIFAIGALVGALFRIFVGAGTDHLGRKRFIQAGIIGYILFALGLIAASRVFHFVALNLLLEISGAIFWTAYSAYFFDIVRKGKEGVDIGARNVVLYSSSAAAPLLAGFAARYLGFNILFLISAAIIFAGFLFATLMSETVKTKSVHIEDFSKEYFDIINLKGFKTIFAIIFISNFIWTFWYIYMPIYLDNSGLSVDKIGLILTSMIGIGALLQHPLGRQMDVKPAKYILIPGFFIIWLFGLSFFAFKNFYAFLVNRIILGFGFDASYWPAVSIFARITPKKEHGGGWALLMAGASAAYGIGALVGGWLTQHFTIELVLQGVSFLSLAIGILIIPNKFLSGKGTSVFKKHHLIHITNHRHK